jgi:hypothetical protein
VNEKLRPFRWDVSRREQLGSLLKGQIAPTYRGFRADLRLVAAKIVARAGDRRLVFVGRSPENLYDYLSGIFHDLPRSPPLTLLHFSSPPEDLGTLERHHATEWAALLGYFKGEKLDPASIVTADRQVRFIDLVRTGQTFTSLYGGLARWSVLQRADWNAVRRCIGFIGITWRDRNSPNVWRWHQNCNWTKELTRPQVTSISTAGSFWSQLGNAPEKTSPSHTLDRWRSFREATPDRNEDRLMGLRLAVQLFDLGCDRRERVKFAEALATQPEMDRPFLRAILLRMKSSKI